MRQTLGLILFLLSCSEPILPSDYEDAGLPDAPPLECLEGLTPCGENCIDLETDPSHCGACDQACSQGADNCTFGICFCGISAQCAPPAECIDELCNNPDENGKPCEFDKECTLGEYCVAGFCTFPACKHEVCDGLDNDCNGTADEIYTCVLNSTQECISTCNTIGLETCGSGGIEGECSWGECVPPAESCNTQDDDCDFFVDEDFDCIPGDQVDCGASCGEGTMTCTTNCIWGPCIGSTIVDICDGLDNDCDNLVDEDELASYCYTGPAGTEFNPPCQMGLSLCLNGQFNGECMFEITPVMENGVLGCDGVDNNCDGCVDGLIENGVCAPYDPVLFDIVFAIDVSGSMGGYIENAKMAVDQLAGQFAGNTNYLFALIEFGDNWPVSGAGEILTDLVEFIAFQMTLSSDLGPIDGGWEPSYDVIIGLANGTLPISWRTGSTRIIIIIGDENGQSSYGNTEIDMCSSLQNGEVLAIVTSMSPWASYCTDYDLCVPADLCFDVSSDPTTMLANLNTIFEAGCAQ